VQLETDSGRDELATFLSEQSGQDVVCVTSRGDGDFQFGNTGAGVKHGDSNARTIHVRAPPP
jgi:hypothetical protein